MSEEALADFTGFFLSICIDQVEFMEGLVQPDRLRDRILIWTEEEIRANALPPKAGLVLEAVLYRGELPRGDVARSLVRASATQGASLRPCRSAMSWFRRAPARRCTWPFRRNSRRLDARTVP